MVNLQLSFTPRHILERELWGYRLHSGNWAALFRSLFQAERYLLLDSKIRGLWLPCCLSESTLQIATGNNSQQICLQRLQQMWMHPGSDSPCTLIPNWIWSSAQVISLDSDIPDCPWAVFSHLTHSGPAIVNSSAYMKLNILAATCRHL